MALADRRPLAQGFLVDSTSTPALPSYNAPSISSAASLVASPDSGGMISSSTNSTTSPQPAEQNDKPPSSDHASGGGTSSATKSKLNDFKDKYGGSDMEIKPLTPEKSLSPVELSPTLRSISPDSLMNSDSNRAGSATISGSTTDFGPHSAGGSNGAVTGGAYSLGSSVGGYGNTGAYNGTGSTGYKKKNTLRAPIATGISTTIPVTGEKPKPEQKNDASLQDDVLYAIFLILYEKDPEGQGMTVKQICDTLVERHPEMANLSTKTSNLVSAKLNAYVKRVEKGDANLKYALSRDWADASPKRMVYVYRGLLAEDFHLHVKSAMEVQKQHSLNADLKKLSMGDRPGAGPYSSGPDSGLGSSTGHGHGQGVGTGAKLGSAMGFGSGSGSAGISGSFGDTLGSGLGMAKPRRQTMYDLGVTKNTFLDTPIDKSNLFVPYLSAPVTASLSGSDRVRARVLGGDEVDDDEEDEEEDDDNTGLRSPDIIRHTLAEEMARGTSGVDSDFEDFEVFDETDNGDDLIDIETFRKFNRGKRSKSLSYLTMGKKSKVLTAAAAAPRASRGSSTTPNAAAAAAAAALHAAAIKAMMPLSGGNTTLTSTGMNQGNRSHDGHNKKWLSVVRSGFMTQDIGAPEDTSLADLDKFFS